MSNPACCFLFQIAGITLQYHTDTPHGGDQFSAALQPFRVEQAGPDAVTFRHHYTVPEDLQDFGAEIYCYSPWAIYRQGEQWVYVGTLPETFAQEFFEIGYFSSDYTSGDIYHLNPDMQSALVHSLSLTITDQIILSQVLADRQACYIHSSGVIYNQQGYLFIGHSGAGKSTTLKLLDQEFEILCDDRMILRRWPDGFHIHGSWSHGEIATVSPKNAPLKAIFFLEQAPTNQIIRVKDRAELARLLPFYIIKPLITRDWWGKMLDLIEKVIAEVPCYRMQFDKSGKINQILREME